MNILFEDDYILVCIKPAGIPTQTARISEKDMVSEVNNYLYKRAGRKTCPVYLIHRLDKPVGGVLVFAKTKDAAAALNSQIASKTMRKRYYAVVTGRPPKHQDTLIDYLLKDSKQNKALICDKNTKDAKRSELSYEVVDISEISEYKDLFSGLLDLKDDTSILRINLITGRFHQIRSQLSNLGIPIVGDTLYGGVPIQKRNLIGLIAYELSFKHPITGKEMEFFFDNKLNKR